MSLYLTPLPRLDGTEPSHFDKLSPLTRRLGRGASEAGTWAPGCAAGPVRRQTNGTVVGFRDAANPSTPADRGPPPFYQNLLCVI